MKKIVLAVLLLVSLSVMAQQDVYVAAKSGLSMRDKPDAKANVLVKIPYAAKISINYFEETVPITTEGMEGGWVKTTYGGKTGYVVNSYLLPAPPPKATVKTMQDYLLQLAPVFGGKLAIKSGTQNNIGEGGWELKKQLYKNGAEWHQHSAYEYGSDTYFLPSFSVMQGFLLLRLIPEFNTLWDAKDEFPSSSKTVKKGDIEFSIKVDKEMLGDSPWFKRISIEYADGAMYSFELYQIDNQLVIFLGSGV